LTHPYATDAYVGSLLREGRAVAVPEWGCSAIVRPITGGSEDGSGAYPLTIMREDADIAGGLARLESMGLVSIVVVMDDFHRPPLERLDREFDFVRPFKNHFVYRPGQMPSSYTKHHRYLVRRALRDVEVGPIDLLRHLDAWMELYATLTARHGFSGIHDLPSDHHRTLATLDGVTAIAAWCGEKLTACHIWVHHRGYVHSHLGASSASGYMNGASYAVYDASIRHFSDAELINLGGVAGYTNDPNDGLARFKRGFANATARSFICGKILDRRRYAELIGLDAARAQTAFFPAYRAT
jgi:hypothetical protein